MWLRALVVAGLLTALLALPVAAFLNLFQDSGDGDFGALFLGVWVILWFFGYRVLSRRP